MAIRCLSCSADVEEDKACIVREVLICTGCNSRVNEFVKLVTHDMRNLDRGSADAIRLGLLTGEFRTVNLGTTSERLGLLIRLVEQSKGQVCHTSQISASSPAQQCGESLPPSVKLLAAVGKKGSTSATG